MEEVEAAEPFFVYAEGMGYYDARQAFNDARGSGCRGQSCGYRAHVGGGGSNNSPDSDSPESTGDENQDEPNGPSDIYTNLSACWDRCEVLAAGIALMCMGKAENPVLCGAIATGFYFSCLSNCNKNVAQ